MDEQDLAGLSAEERAALAGDEDERTNLEDVLSEAGDDDEADETDAGAETTATDTAPGTQSAGATDDGADDDADAPFQPQYVPPSVEGLDDKLTALDAQRNEVVQQFRDGDLSVDDMDAKLREIGAERDALMTEKTKAAVVSELAAQSSQQQWQWEVQRFLKTVKKEEGIDYRADSDLGKKLNTALDFTVKLLANDPENASRENEWFLEEAHRITKARFNLGGQPAAGDKQKPADPKADAVNARRPNLQAVPKTLAHVPAAGSDDASSGDSEFSHLERLDGMALEAAVAKMSPSQQDRWARAG